MHTATTALAATALVVAPLSPVPSASGSGAPPDEVAAGSGVVVNEFVPGWYVELRNTTASTVDVGGHLLWLCEPDGTRAEVRVSLGVALAPGEFHLVASSSFTGAAADQVYRGTLPGGGAVLLDPDHAWVDGTAVVAGSPCGEGVPAPTCPEAATARDAVGTDTGSNAEDFSCRHRSPDGPN